MLDNTSDIVKEIASGNRKILQQLYTSVFPKIRSYILKNNGNTQDAEDIFQKVLIQVIARYKTNPFQIKSTIEGFLYIAGSNLWKRELNKRKNKVTNDKAFELLSDDDDIVLAALEQEKWDLFQEMLNSISENCKKLLQLFFKKVPYKKIVDQLGYKTDNVVRQRIFNCKAQLTKAIQNDARYKELKGL
ncbi:sigma-70 family RNA polymerase sigma factor [uncultured Tenacibaculum sp.]|uniref:RNA polymerase sigma factor n=1 Tax=uncultured Tenacibaculum sp. TaxID=174713 RepID=UPI0026033814|nr:sigma-70 family RNA polymerase sigma factor [uncultured Tenacibaculum sp.]